MIRRFVICFTLLAPIGTAAIAKPVELKRTAPTDQAYTVEVELKVGGNLTIRDPGGKPSSKNAEVVRKLPMSVVGNLGYEEQRVSDKRVARYYDSAKATIKVSKGGKQPSLPGDLRLIVGATEGNRLQLASPNGPLTRDQLDLIDVVGATPYLDDLLPSEELDKEQTWQVESKTMQKLLGLDSVEVCEVSNVVDDVSKNYVKFQVAGTVHGKVEGAKTEFEVRGLGLYSRRHGCVVRFNVAAKETRSLGPATPGFQGVAKVNIKRTPINTPKLLTSARLAQASDKPLVGDLRLEPDDLNLSMRHERGWYVASKTSRSVSLRLIEAGNLVAQATISPLPSKKAGGQPTLEQFESDIKLGLGKSITELVSKDEWTSPAGSPCYSVVARGNVDGLELEYRHYLAVPRGDGSSVGVTVTLAVDDMAAVAAADRLLVEGVQFDGPKGTLASEVETVK